MYVYVLCTHIKMAFAWNVFDGKTSERVSRLLFFQPIAQYDVHGGDVIMSAIIIIIIIIIIIVCVSTEQYLFFDRVH